MITRILNKLSVITKRFQQKQTAHLAVRLHRLPLTGPLDDVDIEIINEIFTNKSYALGFPVGKSVIIDIGAHRGYFALWADRISSGAAHIYSFEPEQSNFEILKKNTSAINCSAFCEGAAGENGVRRLSLSRSVNHSIIAASDESEHIAVPVRSFSSIAEDIDGEIDFCKMDCEGAEYEILLNTPTDVLRKVKVYAVECHWVENYSFTTLFEFFHNSGYTLMGNAVTATPLPMLEGIFTFYRNSSVNERKTNPAAV